MKRRMEKEVEREAGQDLQIVLDPGEGLEAGGRSGSLTNMADVRANMAAVTGKRPFCSPMNLAWFSTGVISALR